MVGGGREYKRGKGLRVKVRGDRKEMKPKTDTTCSPEQMGYTQTLLTNCYLVATLKKKKFQNFHCCRFLCTKSNAIKTQICFDRSMR